MTYPVNRINRTGQEPIRSSSSEVERRSHLTREEFERDFLAPGKPVLIEDNGRDWAQRWTFAGLKEKWGDVQIRAKGEFLDGTSSLRDMRLSELIDSVLKPSLQYRLVTGFPNADHGEDFLKLLPELAAEYVAEGPYRELLPQPDLHHMLWISPAGNRSTFHHDHVYDNLNLQVCGVKEWILFPPGDIRHLYPTGAWQSPVDPFAPDLEKYQRFASTRGIRCVLREGEMLYVPKFWWHCVRSVEPSVNVTTFLECTEPRRLWQSLEGVPLPQRIVLSLAGYRSVRWFGKQVAVSAALRQRILHKWASRRASGPAHRASSQAERAAGGADDAGVSPVGMTARAVAAARARESARPDALFVDPLADRFAGEEGRALLVRNETRMGRGKFSVPFVEVRTRFFDDWLVQALADSDIHQVVLIAAGMDARAWRLPLPPSTVVYELDLPEVLALKEELAQGVACPVRREPIGVDLSRDWTDALLARGFDPMKKSAWLVEGVLLFLEEWQVHALLDRIARLAAPHSAIAADVDDVTFGTSPITAAFHKEMKAAGTPWRFGVKRPEQFFGKHGFSVRVTLPGQPGANYGRWPFPAFPRYVPFIPRSFLVTGTRNAGA